MKKYKVVAQDFNSPFLRSYIWANSFKNFPKKLNLPIFYIGIKSEKNAIKYFADIDSWVNTHNELKKRVVEDSTYVERELIDKTNQLGEEFTRWAESNIRNPDPSVLSNEEVVSLFNEFIERQSELYTYGIMLPTLDFAGFSFVESNLEKILRSKISEEQYADYYSVLTFPIQNSFSQDQEEDLLRLMEKFYGDETWRRAVVSSSSDVIKAEHPAFWSELQLHTKKYAWVYYVYQGPAFTEKQFLEFISLELQKGTVPAEKLRESIQRARDISVRKEEVIRELASNEFEETILRLAGKIVWAKPRRKDYQSHAYYCVEKLLREIASRLKISLNQARALSPDLLSQSLKSSFVDADLLNAIERFHVAFPKEDGSIGLLWGQEAKEFFDHEVEEEDVVVNSGTDELRGTTAFSGKVQGKVCIVNEPSQLHKMNEGDVLVSIATTPSIVPAMKKAIAIVTEEGGLTCHAAIVSRELKTPCVVGTKIATRVFKDGDMVEVDAEMGVVRIIS